MSYTNRLKTELVDMIAKEMPVENDVDLLVTTMFDGRPSQHEGRRAHFDMGAVGAAPRIVTVEVIGTQRIYDGSRAFRVRTVEDPYTDATIGTTRPAREAELTWLDA